MTNSERLEVIEIASQLIRKEINSHGDHLSPEVKAWQKINSNTEDNQWIVVDNLDEEIDLEKIKNEFNKRGYKSKIST
ncbi:hypothetical protein [Cyanobacterium sp. Dongsha4]|uniref:hypothetical protein n=1 Tax=Cyanobacterium sp. DS4 TaxID=2878255 RepID=UPI002E819815|nr:hypothetical protein [Cyanobacterium sp. Dongsha4]WVK99638.1 hypothetical protein Dongsha4_13250 [Cyanobacterium sp. Dongsha4]